MKNAKNWSNKLFESLEKKDKTKMFIFFYPKKPPSHVKVEV